MTLRETNARRIMGEYEDRFNKGFLASYPQNTWDKYSKKEFIVQSIKLAKYELYWVNKSIKLWQTEPHAVQCGKWFPLPRLIEYRAEKIAELQRHENELANYQEE